MPEDPRLTYEGVTGTRDRTMSGFQSPPLGSDAQELPEEVKKKTPDNLAPFVETFKRWFERCQARDLDWQREAQESAQFYQGSSWTTSEVEQLRQEEKAIVNLNRVRPLINLVVGMQLSADTNLRVLGTNPGNDSVAEALDLLIRHVEHRSRYTSLKGMVFRDGLVLGRGWREGFLDYSENPFGELKYGYVSPTHIKFDTYCQCPDLSDMEYLMRAKWFSYRVFKELFPDYEKSPGTHENLFDSWVEEDLTKRGTHSEDDRMMVVEVWWREYRKRFFAISTQTLSWREFQKEEDALSYAQGTGDPSMVVEEFPTRVIRYAIVTGTRFLVLPTDSPYGNRAFPYFPFFPDFFSGYTDSMVTDMKDVQRVLNKTASQTLHMLGQTASRPVLIPEGSVQNPEVAAKNMNRTGKPIIYDPTVGVPSWGEPPKMPSELFQVIDRTEGIFQFITGITPGMMGMAEGSREPASAAKMRASQGSNVLVTAIHNWLQSEVLRGLWTIDAAQRLLLEPQLLRIVGVGGSPDDQVQEIYLNQPVQGLDGVVRIMNDLTVGMYDIRIDHAEAKAALREDQVERLMQLAQAGAPIPTDMIIEMMPGIPADKKIRIIEAIRQAQMMAAQNPGAQMET